MCRVKLKYPYLFQIRGFLFITEETLCVYAAGVRAESKPTNTFNISAYVYDNYCLCS